MRGTIRLQPTQRPQPLRIAKEGARPPAWPGGRCPVVARVAPVRVAAFRTGGENPVRFLVDEDVIGNNFTSTNRLTYSQIIIINPVGNCSQQEKIGA